MHPRCCRPAASLVHHTTSCKISLVLLRMGEIIARNMMIWFNLLISRYCCIQLVVCVICISDARSNKYQIKCNANKSDKCNKKGGQAPCVPLEIRVAHSSISVWHNLTFVSLIPLCKTADCKWHVINSRISHRQTTQEDAPWLEQDVYWKITP